MKKLLIALLLTCSSVTFADNILCPTPTNYSFNGTPWKISLETFQVSDSCIPFASDSDCELVSQYHLYNPVTKILDGSALLLTFNSIQFTYSNAYINNGYLVCEGNYSGEASSPGLIWGTWSSHKTASMKTELPLPPNYKTCVAVLNKNGSSFDCSK